ncbi:hypothetical protein C8F04DRAFT_1253949 [Mycena alexandri]|uniref:Uncharacterized protein n=1 Tax=Mycena alexandri TaxID=1745969 RepID=A0AAD6T8Y0_9AGAR|nr:hypothetical protein C8F04DRAFT_1253949 [Mycena alexandri]
MFVISHGYLCSTLSTVPFVTVNIPIAILKWYLRAEECFEVYTSSGLVVVVGVDVDRFLSKSFQVAATADVDLANYLRGPHCWDGYVLHSLAHDLPPLSLNMGDGFKYFAVPDSPLVPLEVLVARERLVHEKAPLVSAIYAPRLLSEFLSAPAHVTLHEFCAEPVKRATCIPYIQGGPVLDGSQTRTCDPGIDLASYLFGVHCWFRDVLYPLDCDLPPIRSTSNPLNLATHYSYVDSSSIPFEVHELRFRFSDSKVPLGDPIVSGHPVPRRARGFVPSMIHDTCLVYEFLSAPRHITYHQFQSVARTTSFSPGVQVGMSPEVRKGLTISDRLSGVVPIIVDELQSKFSELKGTNVLRDFAAVLVVLAGEVMTLAGSPAAGSADSQADNDSSGGIDADPRSVTPGSVADLVATGSFTAEPGINLANYLKGKHGWGRGVVDGVACWILYPLDNNLAPLLMRSSPGRPRPHFSSLDVVRPLDKVRGVYEVGARFRAPRDASDAGFSGAGADVHATEAHH